MASTCLRVTASLTKFKFLILERRVRRCIQLADRQQPSQFGKSWDERHLLESMADRSGKVLQRIYRRVRRSGQLCHERACLGQQRAGLRARDDQLLVTLQYSVAWPAGSSCNIVSAHWTQRRRHWRG